MKLFVLCALVLVHQSMGRVLWPSLEMCEYIGARTVTEKLEFGVTNFDEIRTHLQRVPEFSHCSFTSLETTMRDIFNQFMRTTREEKECVGTVRQALERFTDSGEFPAFTSFSWDRRVNQLQTFLSLRSKSVERCFERPSMTDFLRQMVLTFAFEVLAPKPCEYIGARIVTEKLEFGVTNFNEIRKQLQRVPEFSHCSFTSLEAKMRDIFDRFMRTTQQDKECVRTVRQALERFTDSDDLPAFTSFSWELRVNQLQTFLSLRSRSVKECFERPSMTDFLRQMVLTVAYELLTPKFCELQFQRFFEQQSDFTTTTFDAIFRRAMLRPELKHCFDKFPRSAGVEGHLETYFNNYRTYIVGRTEQDCFYRVRRALNTASTPQPWFSVPSQRINQIEYSLTNAPTPWFFTIRQCFNKPQIREILRQQIFSSDIFPRPNLDTTL